MTHCIIEENNSNKCVLFGHKYEALFSIYGCSYLERIKLDLGQFYVCSDTVT